MLILFWGVYVVVNDDPNNDTLGKEQYGLL